MSEHPLIFRNYISSDFLVFVGSDTARGGVLELAFYFCLRSVLRS